MGSRGWEWVDYKMPRECASGRFSVLGHQWAGGRFPPPGSPACPSHLQPLSVVPLALRRQLVPRLRPRPDNFLLSWGHGVRARLLLPEQPGRK